LIIELERLVERLDPKKTVLIFGSGSSIPSGGKSGPALGDTLADRFCLGGAGYSLSEVAQIASDREGRAELVKFLRKQLSKLAPAGGVLNAPLYDWNGIYTTNYDKVIERAYEKIDRGIQVISSNFDFGRGRDDGSTRLYKVHGTIESDVIDGVNSRLIITDEDYDLTQEYREMVWDRLRSDLIENNCVIIGQSLDDSHLKDLISRVADLKQKASSPTKIYLLMFEPDPNRAALWSRRNIDVAFGGIDDFFSAMAKTDQGNLDIEARAGEFEDLHALYPVTTVVADAVARDTSLDRMYNGWPASWSDVAADLTFPRDMAYEAAEKLAAFEEVVAIFLGASGSGKTTAARQAILELARAGYQAWEHHGDRELLAKEWIEVARNLKRAEKFGVLFIDEAHEHLSQINRLIDAIAAEGLTHFQLILASPRHDWNPRVKSRNLYRYGTEYIFGTLSNREVDALISLVETQPQIRALVAASFGNFSLSEKRRRLKQSCSKNTFVCLKNIFDNDAFDDIILREFSSLMPQLQEVYRMVAALESLNVRVHRQLVIRLTGIPAASVMASLVGLTDIVEEYSVDEKQGVYGWRGRHRVITEIITKHKFHQQGAIYKLLERVIESLSMTYDIEVRTVRNLCTASGGLSRAGTKAQQNQLLQKLISQAPGERIPRHRLIANLIAMGETNKAETEIRLFENDFREDGPVARYKIRLLLHRAIKAKGLLLEDRLTIVDDAKKIALKSLQKFSGNKHVLTSYCDVGLARLRLSGDYSVFDTAMERLKKAEQELGDPDISRQVEHYARAVSSHAAIQDELEAVLDEVE
jgi:hypothetical protein